MSGVVRASRVVPFPRVTVAHAAIIWSVIVPLQLSAQAEPPLRTLRPEFRLSAEQHNLSALGSVAEGPDGVLAVPQGQDHQIRLFSRGKCCGQHLVDGGNVSWLFGSNTGHRVTSLA